MKISRMIKPESVAVIGASTHHEKVGYQIFANIVNSKFQGKVYPVNVSGGEILNKKVYKSILDIAELIDLAVIAIPASFVLEAAKESIEKGVSAIVVISAGFGEIGADGQKLQDELVKLCQEHDVALLGPNCLGLINTNISFNATFAVGLPKLGKVSLVSQSGAIITALIEWSKSGPIGFSKIFSLGNKALIGETALLEYLFDDPETDVIICYLESLTVTKELSKLLIEKAKEKPTIVLFGGRSSLGAAAAKSHTGSVVSSYLAIETYLNQAGVIVATNLEELLFFGQIFSAYKKITGRRTAIITNAGGPAIACSDALSAAGFSLPALSPKTQLALSKVLRAEASTKNPVDLLGDATALDYEKSLAIVGTDKMIDGIIVILTPQANTKIGEIAEVIARYKSPKPVVSSFVGGEIFQSAFETLNRADKPVFSFPEEAVLALGALAEHALLDISLRPESANIKVINPAKIKSEMKRFNLPIVTYDLIDNEAELTRIAGKSHYPLVVKTAKDETAHKSESGGVALNIQSKEELFSAVERIGFPVSVGKMVQGKLELFLGAKKDPSVGTVIAFGTGGIFAEIYKDFSYRITPFGLSEARKMIHETKVGQILNGARNQQKYDLEKLAQIIVNTSKFVSEYSNIKEVDFNPIIADEDDYHIVDARIITKE